MSDSFAELGLDSRLSRAIARLQWSKPTSIQSRAIPLALAGKDILARARTGSGKTGAYVLPLLQRILQEKERDSSAGASGVRGVILVPTKELCRQLRRDLAALSHFCSRIVRVAVLGESSSEGTDRRNEAAPSSTTLSTASLAADRQQLLVSPDVVVGTPARVVALLRSGDLDIRDSLNVLAVDEADLVLSYGYRDDMNEIVSHLPRIYQALLMSATMSDDVTQLGQMVLHNAVTVMPPESLLPPPEQLKQYVVRCNDEDKFLLMFTLVKLGLVRGKTLIFVNSIDRCYRIKLFLEQFAIRACVLNSELPLNSRLHTVQQFNRGVYDIIVATDEESTLVEESEGEEEEEEEEEGEEEVKGKRKRKGEEGEGNAKKKKKKEGKGKKESESDSGYGVSRGVDFEGVANVINVDFPVSARAYVHRVGRTARGDAEGQALSFVVSGADEGRLERVQETVKEGVDGAQLLPFAFKSDQVNGFKYRVNDALQSVTKRAIKEARLQELKQELLHSEKLKAYFEDNPRDHDVLRHDKNLQPNRIKRHLKTVPDYLLNGQPPGMLSTSRPPRRVFFKKRDPVRKKRADDPLKTFQKRR